MRREPTRHGDDETPRVYVIHENDAWLEPLRREFEAQGVPYAEWFLDRGTLISAPSRPQVSSTIRMSASSHTRDHRYGAEYAGAVLAWLARHGRRVANGERALQLEISKVAQYEALARFGVPSPPTIAVIGKENIAGAAERVGFPLILKHNRGGKGLGVRLFLSAAALAEYLPSPDFAEPVDGITLVQRYIRAPEPFITRVEFVGGRFVYAGPRGHLTGLRALPGRCLPGRCDGMPGRGPGRQVPDPARVRPSADPALGVPFSPRTVSTSPASSSSSTRRAARSPTTSTPTRTTTPRPRPRMAGTAWARSPATSAACSPRRGWPPPRPWLASSLCARIERT
jgi:hypothetical protein